MLTKIWSKRDGPEDSREYAQVVAVRRKVGADACAHRRSHNEEQADRVNDDAGNELPYPALAPEGVDEQTPPKVGDGRKLL